MRPLTKLSLAVTVLVMASGYRIVGSPAPPPPQQLLSHDTPIIVQGGSLKVWAPGGFKKEGLRKLVISNGAPLKFLFVDDNEDLLNIKDETAPVLKFPLNDSWELCSGEPHDLRYFQNGSSLTIMSWDTAPSDHGFKQKLTGSGKYSHGYSHSEEEGFGGLYFSPSHQACSAVVTTKAPCAGTPVSACQVVPQSPHSLSKKVYIVFSTK